MCLMPIRALVMVRKSLWHQRWDRLPDRALDRSVRMSARVLEMNQNVCQGTSDGQGCRSEFDAHQGSRDGLGCPSKAPEISLDVRQGTRDDSGVQ